jgi:hypothetical protein
MCSEEVLGVFFASLQIQNYLIGEPGSRSKLLPNLIMLNKGCLRSTRIVTNKRVSGEVFAMQNHHICMINIAPQGSEKGKFSRIRVPSAPIDSPHVHNMVRKRHFPAPSHLSLIVPLCAQKLTSDEYSMSIPSSIDNRDHDSSAQSLFEILYPHYDYHS